MGADTMTDTADSIASRREILGKAIEAALADCRPDTVRWNYENGLILLAVWRASSAIFQGRWNDEVRARIDALVAPDGSISGYSRDEFNIDQINSGKILLELWKATGLPAYRHAIQTLLGQLELHPRTPTGSFWHKRIYPNQVWLDGLYMGGPFLAACGLAFGRPDWVADVCAQLLKARDFMRLPETGLYRHAWDESGAMPWADPDTGLSPHVWGRALGWLAMALVDILEFLSPDHPRRVDIGSMFMDLAASVLKAQGECGLWWQVMDRPAETGNYLETSASAMFAYSFLKGARLGLLGA
ncbi:MAG TPA: glycoside hydrolase family 88 protein, partial [Rectinemataceae bacterium]